MDLLKSDNPSSNWIFLELVPNEVNTGEWIDATLLYKNWQSSLKGVRFE